MGAHLKVPTQKRNETKNELSWQNEYFFSSSAIVPTTPSERSQNCRCIHHHRSNIAERRLVYVTKDIASNESYSILYVGDASRIWVYGGFHFSRVFFDDDVVTKKKEKKKKRKKKKKKKKGGGGGGGEKKKKKKKKKKRGGEGGGGEKKKKKKKKKKKS